jgi:hypothetical protein
VSENGFLGARFKWRNHHGYELTVYEADDGCFTLRYQDDGVPDDKAKEIDFSDSDIDGLIEALVRMRDFSRTRPNVL